MAARRITPDHEIIACAVCGRTLLRGEHAEVFLAGGERRHVCELCTNRALNQGWIRESAQIDTFGSGAGRPERRPLRDRWRARRQRPGEEPGGEPIVSDEQLSELPEAEYALPDQPRHVHAVPTSGELKAEQALAQFNASEHARTITGVARSLGAPWVSVRALAAQPSIVSIVVSWELCWYRYEVDLGEADAPVRPAGQGYELAELDPTDQQPNAALDEAGLLVLATNPA
ncbi:MAG: hypothetical protein U0R70_07450 [Solirubrobacteraceae bacterium]